MSRSQMRSRVTGRARGGSAPHVGRGSAGRCCALTAAGTAAVIAVFVAAASAQPGGDARVLKDLRQLVAAPGDPPGAIVTLFRSGRTIVLTAGVAKEGSSRPPRATDHMRIASIAKAFSGAIMLQLVQQRRLGIDDTIGRRDPAVPKAWARVKLVEVGSHANCLPSKQHPDACPEEFQLTPDDQSHMETAASRAVQALAYEELVPIGWRVYELNGTAQAAGVQEGSPSRQRVPLRRRLPRLLSL